MKFVILLVFTVVGRITGCADVDGYCDFCPCKLEGLNGADLYREAYNCRSDDSCFGNTCAEITFKSNVYEDIRMFSCTDEEVTSWRCSAMDSNTTEAALEPYQVKRDDAALYEAEICMVPAFVPTTTTTATTQWQTTVTTPPDDQLGDMSWLEAANKMDELSSMSLDPVTQSSELEEFTQDVSDIASTAEDLASSQAAMEKYQEPIWPFGETTTSPRPPRRVPPERRRMTTTMRPTKKTKPKKWYQKPWGKHHMKHRMMTKEQRKRIEFNKKRERFYAKLGI